jgi:hypothetical protein
MLEYGWNLIPVHNGQGTKKEKVPLVKWREYQNDPAQELQIEFWAEKFPDALVGVITGERSGFVVVDCDNDDAAAFCKENGVWSPIRVKTRRGRHLIFRHPRDDRRFGPRVGSQSTGLDWPKFPGLDFRGDGSYVVAFNAPGYSIECDEGFSIYELDDAPEWNGWPMETPVHNLEELDLSGSRILTNYTEWERTSEYIATHYPGSKIPTGASNGRNERVARYAGECVAEGLYGADLERRILAFMDQFYMDRLDDEEWKATLRSIEAAERRNHPERVEKFETEKRATPPEPERPAAPEPEASKALTLLRMSDASALAVASATQPMLIEPFLPVGGIVHISGYTGHGKSMVTSHLMAAGAAGIPGLGPFEFPRPLRVLYLDYENGKLTLARRLDNMTKSYGDAGDRLGVWTPWLEGDDMPLSDRGSLVKLGDYIRLQKPDIVVVDTIRSAWPGINENDADAWAPINRIMVRLRSYNIATIVLHHKNKPQGTGGFSREAGSTAQLNNVETQFYVTQVYRDKARAEATAGIYDADAYSEPVWPKMEAKARAELGIDWLPTAIYEMRYGKVRDWTDRHDSVQWMALCSNVITGEEAMIGSSSSVQRARRMYASGLSDMEIARTLGISLFTIREWLGV